MKTVVMSQLAEEDLNKNMTIRCWENARTARTTGWRLWWFDRYEWWERRIKPQDLQSIETAVPDIPIEDKL